MMRTSGHKWQQALLLAVVRPTSGIESLPATKDDNYTTQGPPQT